MLLNNSLILYGTLTLRINKSRTRVHLTLTRRINKSTPLARMELTEARQIIARLRFSDTDDKRQSPLFGIDGRLQTSMLYKLLKSNQSQLDAKAKFIWSSSTPPRVQFFGWLLISDKIQSRVNLQKWKVLEEATCELCQHQPETSLHLLFWCPATANFWRRLGFLVPSDFDVGELHHLTRPPNIPALHFETFVLLCCLQLWKRRNGVVFPRREATVIQLLQNCKAEARLWACRLPRADAALGDVWCSIFHQAM